VELGYELHPDVWGSGLATEAASATIEVALGTLGLERVVAVVNAGNHRSIRVLEKAGLRFSEERVAYDEPMLLFEITR
jgi:RimJ/RimL family protein N-acetyltransferase